MLRTLIMLSVLVLVAACTGQVGQSAARGATTGAISGAVGKAFGALVFGGDPVEAAARGAVVGAAAGATAGAIVGSEKERRAAEQQEAEQEAELEALRALIGPESFDGLTALAECRHDTALSLAGIAVQSDNADYALAGLWLEALTYTDQRQESEARARYPDLVEQDPEIGSADEAELAMREFIQDLGTIRAEFDLPEVCSV